MTSVMQKGLIGGIALLYGCGNNYEEVQRSYDARLTTLEQQVLLVTQRLDRQERQEAIFLRNLEKLHTSSQSYSEQHSSQQTLEQEIKTTGSNFLSWSKKTLDNLSDFFLDNPEEEKK